MLDSELSYVDTAADAAAGTNVVFLHGNPTCAYLWRNVIAEVAPAARCLAPDLIGMDTSGKPHGCAYRFADHARYLDAWFEALQLDRVLLVVHDWGSALGFDWANRHRAQVRGIAYMEAIVRTVSWAEWPNAARDIFQALRSPAGETLIFDKHVFIERILPGSVLRPLVEAEMQHYRAPFAARREDRRPTLQWPREIPIDGEPPDVAQRVAAYARWLAGSELPKLFINAEPGAILTGPQREFCRGWPNQREVTVAGSHFIQEDSPREIGAAVAAFLAQLSG